MTGTLVLDGTPPLQVPAGASSGDVLTSDSSGNVAWAAPTGGGSGGIPGVTVSGTPVTGQVLTATSTSAADWATPSVPAGTIDWLNVKASPYSAAGNGTTDDTAAIQAAITASANGQVIYLPQGKYLITSPLVIQKNGVTLRGAHGSTASGNDAQFDLGTVLVIGSGFTNSAHSSSATAAILVLDTAPGAGSGGSGGSTSVYGTRVSDLWIDGTSSPSAVDGIAQYGSVFSSQFERVGCYKVTGNAFPQYLDTSYGSNNFPDGQHFYSCLAQVTTGHGFYGAFTDALFIDCHAQQGLGDGWYLMTGGNSRLIGCRADLNVNGFTLDTPRSNTSTSYNDCTTLSGCGTQGNNHNGLNVINSSTAGTSLRQTVVCSGCTFDGDGQASGSGGGGWAGVSVTGRNIVFLDGTAVLTSTEWATGGSPQYGLSTAVAGTSNVAPTSISWNSGAINAQTTLIHDAAPAIDLQVSPLVLGFAGGLMASTTARPFYSRGTTDWVNVCDPHYGADPTGANDSTSAIQKAIAAAGTGTVYFPDGTYLISGSLPISTGLTLAGASKSGAVITSASSSPVFSFPNSLTFWWTIRDLTAKNSSGHIFAPTSSNKLSAFSIRDCSLQANGNASSIWVQSGGNIVEGYWERCDLSQGGLVPTVSAFALTDTQGSYNSNVFRECVCTYQLPATTYFFSWVCNSSSTLSFANAFRDVVFEQCFAGAIFAQGHFGTILDNTQLWDNNRSDLTCSTISGNAVVGDAAITAADVGRSVSGTGIPGGATILSVVAGTSFTMSANATATGTITVTVAGTVADLIHFGKQSSGLSSRGIIIRNCSRENSTLGPSLYDVSFDSTTAQIMIDSFRASPDNAAINLNSCVSTVENQSAGTTIANGSGVVSELGLVAVSGTPSPGMILTATSTSAADWQSPASGAGVTLDGTSTDIQPLGSQAAGSVGKAADAGHVHPSTGVAVIDATSSDIQALGSRAAGSVGKAADAGHVHPTTGLQTAVIDSTATDIAALGSQAAGATGKLADAGHVHPSTGVALLAGATFTGAAVPNVAALTDGSSIAVNAALGNVFTVTIAGNRALANPSNPVDGQAMTIIVKQDGTGSRLLTYGTAYEFTTALPSPTLSTSAGLSDYLGFRYSAAASKWRFLAYIPGFS